MNDAIRRQYHFTDLKGVNLSGPSFVLALRRAEEKRSKKMAPKAKAYLYLELALYAGLLLAVLLGVGALR